MAVCLVFSKSQDPFTNLLRVAKEAHAYISTRVPDLSIKVRYNSFIVSEDRLKIINMHLLNP